MGVISAVDLFVEKEYAPKSFQDKLIISLILIPKFITLIFLLIVIKIFFLILSDFSAKMAPI